MQLTAGPMRLSRALSSQDGKKLFALGRQLRGELVHYDAQSHQFVSYMEGILASGVAFSRDGAGASYVAYPEGTLWRSKLDGSERLQLTFAPMEVLAPRWSPEGKQIVFMGRQPDPDWKLYLVASRRRQHPTGITARGRRLGSSRLVAGNFRVFEGSRRKSLVMPGPPASTDWI